MFVQRWQNLDKSKCYRICFCGIHFNLFFSMLMMQENVFFCVCVCMCRQLISINHHKLSEIKRGKNTFFFSNFRLRWWNINLLLPRSQVHLVFCIADTSWWHPPSCWIQDIHDRISSKYKLRVLHPFSSLKRISSVWIVGIRWYYQLQKEVRLFISIV